MELDRGVYEESGFVDMLGQSFSWNGDSSDHCDKGVRHQLRVLLLIKE